MARAAGNGAPPRSPYGEGAKRFMLSTFGLISAGKGLETAIAALPAIVERHPEVLYVIAGRTHPDIAHREGERYRLSLEQAVLDLGLEDHVEFDDRFLSIDAIADLLATTDVFVTPYRDREQISSGALTFGIAAGCARRLDTVLVRAGHARHGRGHDRAVRRSRRARRCRVPLHRAAGPCSPRPAQRRAGSGRELAWPSVAEATAAVLREAVELAPRRRRSVVRHRSAPREPPDRPPAHAGRRRRHRAARERRDPEPRERLLRRRRRATRRRGARAGPPWRRAGLDVDRLPLDRLPPGCDRRRGRHAELHGLRPPLARRAPPRRPRRPLGLGARRDPLDGLGPRRRRPDRTAPRLDRPPRPGGRVAAHGRVRRPRPRPPRSGPPQSGGPRATGARHDEPCCRLRGQRARRVGSGSRTRSPTTTRDSLTR